MRGYADSADKIKECLHLAYMDMLDSFKRADITAYARSRGAENQDGGCQWWLRASGRERGKETRGQGDKEPSLVSF